jgi:hypothetical protein
VKLVVSTFFNKNALAGMRVAMYIVGQERRLVNPPSQVVAGVRTVTTNMNGRDVLPRLSRPFAFFDALLNSLPVGGVLVLCASAVSLFPG